MKTSEVVQNLRRGYLLALGRSVRGQLNQRRINDEVRQGFADVGHPLSDNAVVKVLIKGREWAIIDGEDEYSASKEQNTIVFCDLRKVMSQSALGRLIGVTQVTISKLEAGKATLTKDVADALVRKLWLNDMQANVVMIASARDNANQLKVQYDRKMVELKREYGDYPQVTLYLGREFN